MVVVVAAGSQGRERGGRDNVCIFVFVYASECALLVIMPLLMMVLTDGRHINKLRLSGA